MLPFDRRDAVDHEAAADAALGLRARPLASDLIALEPRMVFDGAAAATAAAVKEAATSDASSDTAGHDSAADMAADAARLAAAVQPVEAERVTEQPAADTVPSSSGVAPVEIVFIDSRVSDPEAFKTAGGDNRIYVTIGADEDGLAVISRVLGEQKAEVSAVHIIGHGSEGQQRLGNMVLDLASLESETALVHGWQSHLTAEADILLYGCDVAAGADGAALIASLAEKTGADVAGSTDLVGGAASGADWTLDRTTGSIEAAVIAPADYKLLLPTDATPTAWTVVSQADGLSYPALSRGATVTNRNYTTDSAPIFTGVAGGPGVVRVYETIAGAKVLVASSVIKSDLSFQVKIGVFAALDVERTDLLVGGQLSANASHTLTFFQQLSGGAEVTGPADTSVVVVNVDTIAPVLAPFAPFASFSYDDGNGGGVTTPSLTNGSILLSSDTGGRLFFTLPTDWATRYGVGARIAVDESTSAAGTYTASLRRIAVLGTDTDPVRYMRLYLNNNSNNPVVGEADNGSSYYYRIYIVDAAGNRSTDYLSIQVKFVLTPKATITGFVQDGSTDLVTNPSQDGVTQLSTKDSTPTLRLTGLDAASIYTITDTYTNLSGVKVTTTVGTITGTSGALDYTLNLVAGGTAQEGLHQLSIVGVAGVSHSVTTQISLFLDSTPAAFGFKDNLGSVQSTITLVNQLVDTISLVSTTREAAGSTISIEYTVDNSPDVQTATAIVGADLSWSFTIPGLGLGSHVITARVKDSANSWSTSKTVTAFVTGAWSPGGFGLSNLSAWYDASIGSGVVLNGTLVTKWVDLSGSGKDANTVSPATSPLTGVAPSGARTLTFNSMSLLKLALPASNVGIVYSGNATQNFTSTTISNAFSLQPIASTSGRYGPYLQNANLGIYTNYASVYWNGLVGGFLGNYTTPSPYTQPYINNVMTQLGGTKVLFSADGTPLVASAIPTANAAAIAADVILTFGSGAASTTNAGFTGDLGLLVFYKTELTSAQVTLLQNMMSNRFGTTALSPTNDKFVVNATAGATDTAKLALQYTYSNDIGGIIKLAAQTVTGSAVAASSVTDSQNGGLILTDRGFLLDGASIMFGANSGGGTFSQSENTGDNPQVTRFGRQWAIDVEGGSSTNPNNKVDVSFDVASLAASTGQTLTDIKNTFAGRSNLKLAWRQTESDSWSFVTPTSVENLIDSQGRITFRGVSVNGGDGTLRSGFITMMDGPSIESITRSPNGLKDTSLSFTVVTSEQVSNLGVSSFSLKTNVGSSFSLAQVDSVSSGVAIGGGKYSYTVNATIGAGSSGSIWLAYNYAQPTATDVGATNAGNYMIKSTFVESTQAAVLDSRAPQPTIQGVVNISMTDTAPVPVTITFDEAPSDDGASGASVEHFSIDDLDATGGTLSNLTKVDATHWNVNFTSDGTDTPKTIKVLGGATSYKDQYGNVATDDVIANIVVDRVRPTVTSIERVGNAITNADSVRFKVTFSEAVRASSLQANDFAVSGTTTATVTAITPDALDGSVFYVDISGGNLANLNATVGLTLATTASIEDMAFNTASLGAQGNLLVDRTVPSNQTVAIDNLGPKVTSVAISDTYSKSTDTPTITVTFSEAIDPTSFDASDFVVAGGLGSVSNVVVSGNTATATFMPGSAVTSVSSSTITVTPTFKDLAGNAALASTNNVSPSFNLETVAPTVTSITRLTPTAELTNSVAPVFLVTFSEGVRNVGANDFDVVDENGNLVLGSPVLTFAQVTAGTVSTSWKVTVGGLASYNGVVKLRVRSDATIDDRAYDTTVAGDFGNRVTNMTPTGAVDSYTLDHIRPNVTLNKTNFNTLLPTISGTTEAGARITVTYKSTAYIFTAISANWTWTVPTALTAITAGATANPLTVIATDGANNVSTTVSTFLILDQTPPTATISRWTGGASASAGAAFAGGFNITDRQFKIALGEDLGTLTEANFIVTGGVVNGAPVRNGTSNVWFVNVTPTVSAATLSIALQGLADSADNAVNVTASESFSRDQILPTLTSISRTGSVAEATSQPNLSFTVTFSEAVTNVAAGSFVLTNALGEALSGNLPTITNVTSADGGRTYTVALANTNRYLDGQALSLRLAPSASIKDLADNLLLSLDATGTTQAFALDYTKPAAPTLATGFVNSAKPLLSGKAEANSTVSLTLNGGAAVNVTANSAGQWEWTPGVNLNLGANSLLITSKDDGGNVSDPTNASVVRDQTAPTVTILPSVTGTTNATNVYFDLTFSEPINADTISTASFVTSTGLGIADLQYISGNIWRVTLADASAVNGDVSLSFVSPSSIKDRAGNGLSAPSLIGSVTFDHIPPVLSASLDATPVSEISSAPTTTSELGFTLAVSSETGASLSLVTKVGGVVNSDFQLLASGSSWVVSAKPGVTPAKANYEFAITAADPRGNVTSRSYYVTLVDTAAASNILLVNGSSNFISGSSASVSAGAITFQADYTKSNSASVSVSKDDGTVIATGQAATKTTANGWSYALPTGAFVDGSTYVVSITVLDLALKPTTSNFTYSIDKTAPTLQAIDRLTPVGQYTNGASVVFKLTFSEKVTVLDGANFQVLDANSMAMLGVTVSAVPDPGVPNGTVWNVTVSGISTSYNGDLTLKLASGASIVDDASNNVAASTLGNSYTIDHVKPLVAITGANGLVSGSATNATKPQFSGTTSADTTSVTLTATKAGGTPINLGTATLTSVVGGKTWTLTPSAALAEGDYTIKAVATDVAVNDSDAGVTSSFALSVDTTPPNPPVLTSGPSIKSNGSGTVTISGTAASATTVSIRNGSEVLGTANVVGGNWSTSLSLAALPEGTTALSLYAIDAATNVSATATSLNVTIDKTAPTLQAIERLTPVGQYTNGASVVFKLTFSEKVSGLEGANFQVLNAGGVAMSGVTVSAAPDPGVPNGTVWNVTVSGIAAAYNGELTLKLASNASIADDASNKVAVSALSNSYTIDHVKPSVAITRANGPLSGSATNVTKPQFTGTTSADTTKVTLTATKAGGTIDLGTATLTSVAGGKTWTLTPSVALAEGDYTITAVATDVALNDSDAGVTSTFALTIDTTPPNPPVLTSDHSIKSNGSGTVTIRGTAASATTVSIRNGSEVLGTANVVGGNWSTSLSLAALPEVTTALSLYAIDAATNVSVTATSLNVTIDKTAPTLQAIDRLTPVGQYTNGASVVFKLTFSEKVTVLEGANFQVLNADGVAMSGVTVAAAPDPGVPNGTVWNVTVSGISTSYNGELTLKLASNASIADDASNKVAASALSNSYTIDNTAPVLSATLDGVALSGSSAITSNTAFALQVSANEHATLTLDAASSTKFSLTQTGSAWTVSVKSGVTLVPGTTYVLRFTATDDYGTAATTQFDVQLVSPATAFVVSLSASDGTSAISNNASSKLTSGRLNLSADYATTDHLAVSVSKAGGTVVAGGNAVQTSGNAWAFDLPSSDAFVDGSTYTVTLTAYDKSGRAATPSTFTYTSDRTAPVLSVSLGDRIVKAGETTTLTISSNETIGSFDGSKVSMPAGVLGSFTRSADGKSYSATFTPNGDVARQDLSVTLAAGAVTDNPGNPSVAYSGYAFSIDTQRPKVASIVRTDASTGARLTTKADSVVFVVTFSEDVTNVGGNDFAIYRNSLLLNSTIEVAPQGESKSVYLVTVSNYAGDGDIDLKLAASPTINDLDLTVAGASEPGNALADTTIPAGARGYTIDRTGPTVSGLTAGPLSGGARTITITFSEAVDSSTFTLADLTWDQSLGDLSNLTFVNDRSATAIFTQRANVAGAQAISVAGGDYTDLFGNTARESAERASFAVDTVAPVVTSIARQSPASQTTNAASVTFRVTFSEAVKTVDPTDFVVNGVNGVQASDLTVAPVGGSVGSGSLTWDVTVRGSAFEAVNNGTVSLGLAAGAAIDDLAGNGLSLAVVPASETFVVNRIGNGIASGTLTDDVGTGPGEFALVSTVLTNDARPVFNFVSNGDLKSVAIYEGATLVATALKGADAKHWSWAPTGNLSETTHQYTAKSVDIYDNETPFNFAVTVDTVAPNKPVVGAYNSAGSISNNAVPALSGTAEAGTRISLFIDGAEVAGSNIIAREDGTWSYAGTMPLADGQHSFVAYATDSADNRSVASNNFAVVIDTFVSPPLVTRLGSTSIGDRPAILSPDAAPVFSGKGEAKAALNFKIWPAGAAEPADFTSATHVDDNGDWTWSPGARADGAYLVKFHIKDVAGNEATGTSLAFTIDTTAPVLPAIDADVLRVNENARGVVVGSVAASDLTPVAYAITSPGTPFEIDGSGQIRVSQSADIDFDAGPKSYSVTVQATDAAGHVVSRAYDIAVTNINEAPVAGASLGFSTLEDTGLAGVIVGFSDQDQGDVLTYSVSKGARHGALSMDAAGAFTYMPAADFFGADTFEVTATDSSGLSASKIVSIQVQSVNDAPVIAPAQTIRLAEDATGTGASGASDVDADKLTYLVSTQAAHGLASVDTSGAIIYRPDANFHGDDSFTIEVSDGQASALQRVSVSVTPVNDAPTGAVRIAGTPQTGQTLTVTPALADADGVGALSYQWLSNGQPVGEATGDTFVVRNTDSGAAITCSVTYTDGDGVRETVLSQIVNVPSIVVQTPVIVPVVETKPVYAPIVSTQTETFSVVEAVSNKASVATLSVSSFTTGTVIEKTSIVTSAANNERPANAVSPTIDVKPLGVITGGRVASTIVVPTVSAASSPVSGEVTGSIPLLGNEAGTRGAGASNTSPAPTLSVSRMQISAVDRGAVFEVRIAMPGVGDSLSRVLGENIQIIGGGDAVYKFGSSIFVKRGQGKVSFSLEVLDASGERVIMPVTIDPSAGTIEVAPGPRGDLDRGAPSFAQLLRRETDPQVEQLLASLTGLSGTFAVDGTASL